VFHHQQFGFLGVVFSPLGGRVPHRKES
jgi:hypothetical protein